MHLKGYFSILVIEHVLSETVKYNQGESDKHVNRKFVSNCSLQVSMLPVLSQGSGLSVPVTAVGKLLLKALGSESADHLRKCDN